MFCGQSNHDIRVSVWKMQKCLESSQPEGIKNVENMWEDIQSR